MTADVFEALARPAFAPCDAMITNLFLHHFSESRLIDLLGQVQEQTRLFIALEPRRSQFALLGSRWVGLIGCNEVTRHDAPVSVRAGFAGQELTGLWSRTAGWSLQERPAGLFSHLFIAQRREDERRAGAE